MSNNRLAPRRRLNALVSTALLAFVVALALSSSAQAANTITLSSSADPTEDEAVSVSASGTSEAARSLFVFRELSGGDCGSTASEHYSRPTVFLLGGTFGTGVGPGSFSKTNSFTPTAAGTYRICAYLAESSTSAPIATATHTFEVRLPTGTLSLGSSADATEDEAVSVSASGTSEAARSLFVFRELSGGDCAPTASEHYSRPTVFLLGGTFGTGVGPGSFSKTNSFTPTAAGTYRICAYLAESSTSAPIATATHTFEVRLPAGAITLGSSADPTENQAASVSAAGTSEAARSLFVFRELSGGDCAPTASEHYSRPTVFLLGGTFGTGVGPGSFNKTNSFTPTEPGRYRICAYLAETSASAPIGTATVTFDVANDPSDDPPPDAAGGASNQPAPPLAIVGPEGGRRQTDRRPVFSWHAAPGFTDELVLEDGDGQLLAVIAAEGTFAPTDEDDEDVVNADDYYDDVDDVIDPSVRTTFDQYYVERVGADRVKVNGNIAEVRMRAPLPPGRYRWRVERSVRSIVGAKSDTRALAVLGPPLTRLKVRQVSKSYRSSRNPGYTRLKITTTPFAGVRVTFARDGRQRVLRYAWGGSAHGEVGMDWTCKVVGAGRYRWSVTASDAFGKTLKRAGSFRTVTRADCRAYRAAERAAARRRAAARERRRAAERTRARREAAADYRRRARNCAALGGNLRSLEYADGSSSLVCVSPLGVFVAV